MSNREFLARLFFILVILTIVIWSFFLVVKVADSMLSRNELNLKNQMVCIRAGYPEVISLWNKEEGKRDWFCKRMKDGTDQLTTLSEFMESE